MCATPRGLGLACKLLCALSLASVAGGEPRLLSIDPARSHVELVEATSFAAFDFGLPFMAAELALDSQGPGDVLPDGTTSDGRRTSLEGTVLVEITSGEVEVIGRRTSIGLGDSGSYLPGLPGSAATPAPAELAVALSDGPLGLDATLALRGLVASFELPPTALQDADPDRREFDAQTGATLRLLEAKADLEALVLGPSGRVESGRGSVPNEATPGHVDDLGDGELEVTIPIYYTLELSEEELASALPAEASLHLSGRIVATSVPEPGAAASLAAAFAALGGLARRRRASGRRRSPAPAGRATAALAALLSLALLGCGADLRRKAAEEDSSGSGSGAGAAPAAVAPATGTPATISSVACESELIEVRTEGGLVEEEVDVPAPPCPDSDSRSVTGTVDGNTHAVTGRYRIDLPTTTSAHRFTAECALDADLDGSLDIGGPFCRVDPSFGFDVSTPSGGETTLVAFLNAAGVGSGAGDAGFVSASVDCPGDFVLLDPGEAERIVLSGDGTCVADLELSGSITSPGRTVRHATLLLFPGTLPMCDSPAACSEPTPFCGGGVCHDGSEGSPCGHQSECAAGLYCGPTGACQDGSAGDACDVDADCASESCASQTCG